MARSVDARLREAGEGPERSSVVGERASGPMPSRLWSSGGGSGGDRGPDREPIRQPRGRGALLLGAVIVAAAAAVLAVLASVRSADQAQRARRVAGGPAAGSTAATRRLDRALDDARRARDVVVVGSAVSVTLVVLTAAAAAVARRRSRGRKRSARGPDAASGSPAGGPPTGGPIAGDPTGNAAARSMRVGVPPDAAVTLAGLAGAVLESSPDLLLVVAEEGGDRPETRRVVRYASPAATSMLGRPSEWLANVPVASFVHPDDRPRLMDVLDQAGTGTNLAAGAVELRFSHVQGRWVEAEVRVVDLRDHPDVGGVALHLRNLFERKQAEEELRHLALHDPLTRLANRALFHEHVEHALARNRRTAVRPHAVLIVDIDEFKNINDSLGHAAGDQVLVELAERLRTRVRPGDTAARMGGDEFAILLENSSEQDAGVVALRILEAVAQPLTVLERNVVVSGSIGIAFSEAGQDAETLMRNADVAMYAAKAAGKGRYQMFRAEMGEAVLLRLDLEADLRRAVEQHELVLHYQPIIHLAPGAIVGMEVLVRWQHPDRGLMYPADFIGVAEESGLIRPMGRWILEQACRQERAWVARFGETLPFGVSVNVSPAQVDDPGFVDDVVASLDSTGTDPAKLTLEITESLVLADFDVAVEKLRRLKGLGVKIAIDDFGTGWSSFSRLRSMPIDVLKIDKTFIDGVTRGPEDSAVAQAVIKMAHTFGLEAVAEGIEFPAQAERLVELHCDMGQGYYFGPPLSVEATETYLRRRT